MRTGAAARPYQSKKPTGSTLWAFGGSAAGAGEQGEKSVREITLSDAAVLLNAEKSILAVPVGVGYAQNAGEQVGKPSVVMHAESWPVQPRRAPTGRL